MCRVLVHIYLWTFFDSGGFTLLSWKKPIIHVLSEVMKRKTVNSYCFIITVFQNPKFYYVLSCSEDYQRHVKQDNNLMITTLCVQIVNVSVIRASLRWLSGTLFQPSGNVFENTWCPKQIARIRGTQNRFSGSTSLMCTVLVHIYFWTFFDSGGFTLLSWTKPIIHVLSEVMKGKTVNSYCFIIRVFQNPKFFYVLLCPEYHQRHVKQDNNLMIICHYSVCAIIDNWKSTYQL